MTRTGRRCPRHDWCGDACPLHPGTRYEDWEVADPAGQSLDVVRRIRDDIGARVRHVALELEVVTSR